MNWFSYGYTKALGHHLDGPVPDQYRRVVTDIINRSAPYRQLPDQIPYVGHFEIVVGLWLVLAKPAGLSTFYGRIIPEEEYSVMGFSPYQLVVAEPPLKPILKEVGRPFRTVEKLPATGSARYLSFAAQIFEELAVSDRRRTHHSITVNEDERESASFVFKEGSGEKSLDLIEKENSSLEPPVPTSSVDINALLEDVSDLRHLLRNLYNKLNEVARSDSNNESLAGLRDEVRVLGDKLAEGPKTTVSGIRDILKRFEFALLNKLALSEQSPKRPWLVAFVGAVGLLLGAAVVFVSLSGFRGDMADMKNELGDAIDNISGIKNDIGVVKGSLAALEARPRTNQGGDGQ